MDYIWPGLFVVHNIHPVAFAAAQQREHYLHGRQCEAQRRNGSRKIKRAFKPLDYRISHKNTSCRDYITGPGILQIAVVAGCEGYEKLFHASINMIRPISAAGLMETLSDGSGYRISRSEAELDVDAVLHITREQVIPGEDGQGIEIWFEKENIDVEL